MPILTVVATCILVGVRRLVDQFRQHASGPSGHHAILQEIRNMSESFNSEMSKLQADIAAQSSVIGSATAAFRGLTHRLVVAEAAAKNAGATDAQIASVTALREQLESNTNELAAAVPANTEASAPVAAPEPVPTPVVAPASSSVAADAPAPAVPATSEQPVVDPATLAANQAR